MTQIAWPLDRVPPGGNGHCRIDHKNMILSLEAADGGKF